MKHEHAERLFREYLELRGWSFWDETHSRQMMNLRPDSAAPDFTLLNREGKPTAFVEVSEVAIKQADLQRIQTIIRSDRSEENLFDKPSPSRFYQKLRKEINQLKRFIDQRHRAGQPHLPTMLVVHDPLGTAFPTSTFVLHKLLGLAITFVVDPAQGKAVSPMRLLPTERGVFFQEKNRHISAIALLEEKKVLAIISGYEKELEDLDYRDLSEVIPKVGRITKKYVENGINIDYSIPVLTIFCNPFAQVAWPSEFWGRYDQVWGVRGDSYDILYDGLIELYQGTLRGVSLPPPEQTSRASGFYDE